MIFLPVLLLVAFYLLVSAVVVLVDYYDSSMAASEGSKRPGFMKLFWSDIKKKIIKVRSKFINNVDE